MISESTSLKEEEESTNICTLLLTVKCESTKLRDPPFNTLTFCERDISSDQVISDSMTMSSPSADAFIENTETESNRTAIKSLASILLIIIPFRIRNMNITPTGLNNPLFE